VKNDLQHGSVVERPDDRWLKLGLSLSEWRTGGRSILVAAPDEKPCKFYGVDKDAWVAETVATIKQFTDRPVIVRDRAKLRSERITNTLQEALSDTFALVTFNSVAATEAIMYGIPAFTLVNNAASPMALQDLGGYTKIASAILIMGIIGGAIFPLIYGSLVESINLANEANGVAKTAKSGNQVAYLMLLPTYIMIIFYAFKGHKYRNWSRK
jgi:hypothetical protein